MPVYAKIDGEWYRCGVCGHKLAKRIQGYICSVQENEVDSKESILEIKCKHKSGKVICDTINEIVL